MIYILANNTRQANLIARERFNLSPTEFKIIRDEFDLQGRRGLPIFCVGSYALRHDWARIYGILKVREAKIFYVEED